jgi:hypothetical protein
LAELDTVTAWGSLLSGAGAIVAGIAVYFSYQTTRRTIAAQSDQNHALLDSQERGNRSELVWGHRIAAYEEAIEWLNPILTDLTGVRSDRSPVMAPEAFAAGTAVPSRLDARLRIYASGEVLAVLVRFRGPLTTTREVVGALVALEATMRYDIDRSAWRIPR